jgi:hypothetical protein
MIGSAWISEHSVELVERGTQVARRLIPALTIVLEATFDAARPIEGVMFHSSAEMPRPIHPSAQFANICRHNR